MTDAAVQLLGQIPPAVYVLLLLAGPTLAWLAYRSMSGRRSLRSTSGEVGAIPIEAEYWQCPDCLSLTPMTQPSCYSCGFEPGLDDADEVDDRAPVAAGTSGGDSEAPPPR